MTDLPLFPQTIRLPARTTKIVYLDLNHWISLSRLKLFPPKSDKNLFRDCVQYVHDGKACFPLSMHTYVELEKNRNYRQRRDLRKAIEEVSQYTVVTGLHVVTNHEIEALLNEIIGPNPNPIGDIDYIDWGVFRSIGLDGRFRVIDKDGKDITEDYFQNYPDKDYLASTLFESFINLNRGIIEGPAPDDEAEFRNSGWSPESLLKPYENMALHENKLVSNLDDDPKWRKDPALLRKVVSARHVFFSFNETLKRAFLSRGIYSLEEVFRPGTNDIHVFDRMPSFDVYVSLVASFHRNPDHLWRENHIHDISALALTIPYCDIVVTDKEMASHVKRTGLDKRMSTVVLSKLSKLSDHLLP